VTVTARGPTCCQIRAAAPATTSVAAAPLSPHNVADRLIGIGPPSAPAVFETSEARDAGRRPLIPRTVSEVSRALGSAAQVRYEVMLSLRQRTPAMRVPPCRAGRISLKVSALAMLKRRRVRYPIGR